MLKIGSHISCKSPNYLVDSVQESLNNGANAMMIFLGPPQSFKRVDVSNFKLKEYKEKLSNKLPIENIIVHAPYVLNLANEEKSNFSKLFLIEEINRMNQLGLKFLVLHPGASLKQDLNESLDHLVINLKDIINKTKNVEIILETMAGKGTELGVSISQLSYLVKNINSDRIGICLDTCHMWDAGYDIKADFEDCNGEQLISELKHYDLLNKIKVIHLNDSKNTRGSKKDRHANIGHGFIGKKALINFAHHKQFDNIPIILETPYFNEKPIYDEEIKIIKERKY